MKLYLNELLIFLSNSISTPHKRIRLFSSFSFAEDNNLLLDKAERLIETRHLSEINVSTSKDIVLKTLETDSDNLKANWLMSRIYSLLGDKTKTNDEKIKIYNNWYNVQSLDKKIDFSFENCSNKFFYDEFMEKFINRARKLKTNR